MTAKFTKGSWQYDEGCGCVLDEHGDIICDVMPDGREECEHNGYVLAQAGAMYEMLETILKVYEMDYDDTDKALKLLAKARGEV